MIYRYGHTAPLLRLSLPKHTQESRMPTEPHTLSHVIVGVFTLSLSHTHTLSQFRILSCKMPRWIFIGGESSCCRLLTYYYVMSSQNGTFKTRFYFQNCKTFQNWTFLIPNDDGVINENDWDFGPLSTIVITRKSDCKLAWRATKTRPPSMPLTSKLFEEEILTQDFDAV